MNKFEVGDRIRVYEGSHVAVEIVTDISANSVVTDNGWYHPKQCRKLKPKKKRRVIWVNIYERDLGNAFSSKEKANEVASPNCICRALKFIEAKNQK